VSGIGDQRQRIGPQAEGELRGDKPDIERGGNRKGAAEIRRHVAVAADAMRMAVRVIV